MADIPHTFRSGPGDPVAFADGPGTFAETHVAAPPGQVWELVTDIDLPARFSEEFLGADWVDPGPALGASFVGRNENATIGRWELVSFVDRFEHERLFGWCTSDRDDPGARWWFTLTPTGDGTHLRFEVSLGPGPSGLTFVIASRPDKEPRIIARRLEDLHANMQRTVDGIRDLAEGR